LFEYAGKLLEGEESPTLKYAGYFDQLPSHIDFSEEFLQNWQKLVSEVIHKFIVDSFSLYRVALTPDGFVKQFGVTDEIFWESIDLKFSHRGALRIYEKMLESSKKEPPSYLIALPADALFLSVATGNFNEYSYPWLFKNKANWVVQALFVIWQPVFACQVHWKDCFDDPGAVEMPLRALLLERASLYFACLNHLIRRRTENVSVAGSNFIRIMENKSSGAMHFRFFPSSQIAQASIYARSFAKSVESAFQYWTSEGSVALDDDRFLRGVFNNCGLASEMREFENVLSEYQSQKDLEENVNESVIFS
jgi:hypothetical protein